LTLSWADQAVMINSRKTICIVLGGGGHARVLIESLQAATAAVIYGILDRDRSRWGKDLCDVPILGGDELLPELVSLGVNSFVVGLGSAGDNRPRQHLFELALSYHLEPLTIVHPKAVCSRWAELGPGAQLFPGSIVNGGTKLGANVIVNSGAIVEHDCVLCDHVHIATGACLASTVYVGEGAHIGIGASIRQCIHVGRNTIVGAGAVVVRDVPDNVIVAGVPAKILRKMDDNE